MIERYDRPVGTVTLLGFILALAGTTFFWTTSSWPIRELVQLGVPTWVTPLLLAEVIQCVVVIGGFLLISRLSAWQIGLRWDAIPSGLVGGLLVWALAQCIALGPTGAVVAARSATPLLLTVRDASGLLLAYAAAGVLEETEFRGILLGQLVARLRSSTGAGIAVLWLCSARPPSSHCCICRRLHRSAGGRTCESYRLRCRKWRSWAWPSGCATS